MYILAEKMPQVPFFKQEVSVKVCNTFERGEAFECHFEVDMLLSQRSYSF